MSRVLLVEPDRLLSDSYSRALELAGHTVIKQSSAQAAVTSIDTQCPDVILLELQMSAHNGIEFLYELRSYPEWQAIPVIVLSMIPDQASNIGMTNFKQLGVVGYLYKPQTKLRHIIHAVNAAVATEAW